MKRWLVYVSVGLALVLPLIGLALKGESGMQALVSDASEVFSPPVASIKHASINYGVYDHVFGPNTEKALRNAKKIAIEHIFVSWLSLDDSEIRESYAYAHERNRWLMITIEPFTDDKKHPAGRLLAEIVAGTYDLNIEGLCREIGSLGSPVLIRWGHEMEHLSERYPWAGQPPDDFISAYRYFVRSCRNFASDVYFVWSPRGDIGLAEYYPGRQYADIVGISLYSFPVYSIDTVGHPESFVDVFAPRYQRVIAFNLPVIIAEFGVAGSPAYQASWMRGLFRNADKFPLLQSAVYFNAKDSPNVWPEKYGIPDWRISPEIFE